MARPIIEAAIRAACGAEGVVCVHPKDPCMGNEGCRRVRRMTEAVLASVFPRDAEYLAVPVWQELWGYDEEGNPNG